MGIEVAIFLVLLACFIAVCVSVWGDINRMADEEARWEESAENNKREILGRTPR
jgi:hypothetical protein